MNKALSIVMLTALGTVLGETAYHCFKESPAEARHADPQVVTAKRFDLVDAGGRLRAELALADGGAPGLWFFDERGKARLNVGVYADGEGFVVVNDATERAVGILRSVGPASMPVLVLKTGGVDRLILGIDGGRGEPFLAHDAAGKRVVEFGPQ